MSKTKDPLFAGIDASLTGFAIVLIDINGNIVEKKLKSTKPNKSYEERFIELENEFKFIANVLSLKGLYIEGPSYHSKGRAVVEMGGLNYFVRMFFYKKNIDYKIITPTELKKFVTGKGTAKKELIIAHVYKKWNIMFESNDLADAYSLARMALEDYRNE